MAMLEFRIIQALPPALQPPPPSKWLKKMKRNPSKMAGGFLHFDISSIIVVFLSFVLLYFTPQCPDAEEKTASTRLETLEWRQCKDCCRKKKTPNKTMLCWVKKYLFLCNSHCHPLTVPTTCLFTRLFRHSFLLSSKEKIKIYIHRGHTYSDSAGNLQKCVKIAKSYMFF